ncbi:MAG: 1-acyl-sn-glycerol-3-phosphate acyltransferase [Acidobacteria bacterium]|nr:1-acyl-sn-glycerol-3-phosphate acyltransferase [Acidobacteriota bacterium]
MFISHGIILAVKLLIGAYPRWQGCAPNERQRIYFANHSSHLDALTLWAALPPALRRRTHPVAARDYWETPPWRRALAIHGFNAVFLARKPKASEGDPLQSLVDVLARGDSLILFPEGTRRDEALPGEFKSGLFHLAQRFPAAELVPVYLENLYRSMPKGTPIPVPLICSVRFGAVLERHDDEAKHAFLSRARAAVIKTAEQNV